MNHHETDPLYNENVIGEDEYMDIQTGTVMSKKEFVAKINNGQYPGYYVTSDIAEYEDDIFDDLK